MRGLGVMAIVATLATASACRDSGGECEATDHADVAGTWALTTVIASSCEPDEVGQESTDEITATQEGAELTIDASGVVLDVELDGAVCGASFSARGTASAAYGDCTGSETMVVSGTVDGDTAEGDIRYTGIVDDPAACLGLITSCSRTSTFTAERLE